MASFNRVLLMGNLVRDPELRVTPNGLSVCRFTIACSRTIKAEAGPKEETTFVDVEAFGKTGEVVAKYFTKGRPIFVEGRLRLNEWQTNTGEKRSKLLVILENFVFVGSAGQQRGGESSLEQGRKEENSPSFSYEKVDTKGSGENAGSGAQFEGSDEDVPF